MAGKRVNMQPRDWTVMGVVDPATAEFIPYEASSIEHGEPKALREAILSEMADVESIGDKIGGQFALIPLRGKVVVNGREEHRTVGWRFVWQPYAPAVPINAGERVETADDDVAPAPAPAVEERASAMQAAIDEAGDRLVELSREQQGRDFSETDPDDVTPLGAEVAHPFADDSNLPVPAEA